MEKVMVIALASDHGGFELKMAIREHLQKRGFKTVDLGTNTSDSVDYPVYGKACGEAVAKGMADLGMVFCGSGVGISIAANKIKGVRCALCTNKEMGRLAREHNNANMIAMGGRFTDVETAIEITDAWLDGKFEGGRHERRVNLLNEM